MYSTGNTLKTRKKKGNSINKTLEAQKQKNQKPLDGNPSLS